jgi:DNA gyrase inhibitor GyrI
VTQSAEGKAWLVRFVMPASYTMKTLPEPVNKAVQLREVPASRYAVIRFSGMGDQKSLEKHTSALEAFIKEKSLESISEPTYAFFNPPWTLPPLRRNEVMIEVAAKSYN